MPWVEVGPVEELPPGEMKLVRAGALDVGVYNIDGELLAPAERARIEDRMRGLREAMAGTDYLAVKAWIESVDAASKEFAERRMNKHVAKAMAGHRVDEFAALVGQPRVTGSKEDDLENPEQ